jgi:hypothetical protein
VHDPELRILASALGSDQHPAAQKVEAGTPVHGALDDLQTVDLALDRAGAPGHRQGGMHGVAIVTEARGEAFEATSLGSPEASSS